MVLLRGLGAARIPYRIRRRGSIVFLLDIAARAPQGGGWIALVQRPSLFDAVSMESTRWSRLAVLYASTIFLSAFLLFQVQPLISRFILPWFGGGPAVWTTCLLFFQTVLFAGYAYAHVSEHYFRPRVRTIVHLTLIGAALLTLPITPSDWWKPEDSGYPTARILALLAVCVGLPYFVLSSTGPLVQAWFSQTLSGPVSLSALFAVEFRFAAGAVELSLCRRAGLGWKCPKPVVDRRLRAVWHFMRHRLLANGQAAQRGGCDRGRSGGQPAPDPGERRTAALLDAPAAVAGIAGIRLGAAVGDDESRLPGHARGSVSVGRAAELVSVVVHHRLRSRALVSAVAVWAGGADRDLPDGRHVQSWPCGQQAGWDTCIAGSGARRRVPGSPRFSYEVNLVCQFTGLFALCMLCHGELVRLRPAPRYLTSFYLMISAGGALGGLSVSLIAPQLFNTYAEWKIGLVAGFVLAATVAFVLAGSTGSGLAGWSGLRRRRLSLPRRCGPAACWQPAWRCSRSFSYCEMTPVAIAQYSNKRETFTAS